MLLFRRWLSASLILLAVGLGGGVTAHAADSDGTNALATAPQGILLNRPDPFLTTETASKSSATVVSTTNPNTPGTQAVRVTDLPDQFGSVWSTTNHEFNLTKTQTLSMWLYFGNQGTSAGSGMAFVLQNDPRGLKAMPAFTNGVVPETLGVWATDTNVYQNSNVEFAKTAIQDSWALEFDTRYNGGSGSEASGTASAFDSGYAPVHVASNYPAAATTYVQRQLPGLFGGPLSRYYYTMVHDGVIDQVNQPDFLSNGQWHHLTLKWDAAAHNMTYIFDDRDPATDAPQLGETRTVHLDLQRIDPDNTGRVRWGFTGTTGDRFETNLVVLENAPGLVNAKVSAQLTDLTRNRVIQTDGQVLSNDQVRLDYRLTYIDGQRPWANIEGHLRLPTGIHFTEAQILYSDRTSEKLAVSDLTTRQLATKIKKDLDGRQSQATIQLTGTVKVATSATSIPATTSVFTSPEFVTPATTPAFTVNPGADLRVDLTSGSQKHLATDQDTVVTGKVNLAANQLMAGDVTLTAVLNGRPLTTRHPQTDGTFQFPISAKQLRAGTNQLAITATTTRGDRSNTAIATLTVAGELKFAAVSAVERFQSSKLTGKSQLVSRAGNWQLVVQDTRGTGDRWTLLAQASEFTTGNGTRLAGQPVYVTPYQTIPIGDTPTPVYAHVTDDSVADGLVNVAADWTRQTGVMLAVNGGSAAGEYSGQLTWTLADAPA